MRIHNILNAAKINQSTPHIFTLPTLDKATKRVYVKGKITLPNILNTNEVTFFFDCGSDVNVISKSFLTNIFPEIKESLNSFIKPSTTKVAGFSGAEIEIFGEITIIIQLNENLPFIPLLSHNFGIV